MLISAHYSPLLCLGHFVYEAKTSGDNVTSARHQLSSICSQCLFLKCLFRPGRVAFIFIYFDVFCKVSCTHFWFAFRAPFCKYKTTATAVTPAAISPVISFGPAPSIANALYRYPTSLGLV